MNEEEEKHVEPGQLFEVMSPWNRGIVCVCRDTRSNTLFIDQHGWGTCRLREGSILMLVRDRLSPVEGQVPNIGPLDTAEECIYEFLCEEILVYLHKAGLRKLEHVY